VRSTSLCLLVGAASRDTPDLWTCRSQAREMETGNKLFSVCERCLLLRYCAARIARVVRFASLRSEFAWREGCARRSSCIYFMLRRFFDAASTVLRYCFDTASPVLRRSIVVILRMSGTNSAAGCVVDGSLFDNSTCHFLLGCGSEVSISESRVI
jgi:hypothetical protein